MRLVSDHIGKYPPLSAAVAVAKGSSELRWEEQSASDQEHA